MRNIKVVSFDADGTLVTPDFGQTVWYEGIPALYARKHGTELEKARAKVEKEYQEVGERRKEWYDIKYWFKRFQLGDYQQVLENHRHKLVCYSEVPEVLLSLNMRYTLIVASGSAREFLAHMLHGIDKYFARIFSSISDYQQLKSPDFYLKVCRDMGIRPNEMVHVGDDWEFDFLAAKEAGITAFHLNRQQKSGEKISLTNLRELEARVQDRC